jgi:hypothetical protein
MENVKTDLFSLVARETEGEINEKLIGAAVLFWAAAQCTK